MNRHLIVVEGFVCPCDARSHVVWASLPLVGSSVTTTFSVKGQTKCGSRRPACLVKRSSSSSTPSQVRAARFSWTRWCGFASVLLFCGAWNQRIDVKEFQIYCLVADGLDFGVSFLVGTKTENMSDCFYWRQSNRSPMKGLCMTGCLFFRISNWWMSFRQLPVFTTSSLPPTSTPPMLPCLTSSPIITSGCPSAVRHLTGPERQEQTATHPKSLHQWPVDVSHPSSSLLNTTSVPHGRFNETSQNTFLTLFQIKLATKIQPIIN